MGFRKADEQAKQEHGVTAEARMELDSVIEKTQRRAMDALAELADGFAFLDEAWRYVFVNAAAGRLLGKTPEELRGKVIWEVFPEAVDLPIYEHFHRAVREKVALQFEQYYPGLGWFENRCQPTRGGLAVYSSEVTSRKATEAELQRSQERYRKLLELAPDAVLVHQDGRVAYANAAALRLFGSHGVEDLLGRGFLDFVHPEDRAALSRR
ncbi:MAG TPA: PAS domain-containing protein, partial [Bacillota bacterium]|nr:PAS domain-containing protein [Bacillota bacterium]